MAVSLAVVGPIASAKADDNVVERQLEHRSDTRSWFPEVYRNPAMQWNRYRYSLNRLASTYTDSRATLPQQLEHGDKTTAVVGDIDAFLRKKHVSLWGTAHYANGKTRHIRYNETTDFDLLYPYVMADTVGGGVSRKETYDFTGASPTTRTDGQSVWKAATRPGWNTGQWTRAPRTSRETCR